MMAYVVRIIVAMKFAMSREVDGVAFGFVNRRVWSRKY
jgi:hypothetical protein